ncbi:MAG: hypothetical protein CVU51_05985 [Deltaproteobacteria bacterium HGW-Deltaproteobacteria-1]|jgi:hypothetical protein|nr:MAG: hypothetical protein CVU51_05985 [Deltaproteobacteria bacterium HGW-Deltaproteobacteria-1]
MKQKNRIVCFVLIGLFLSVIVGCGGGGGEGAGVYMASPAPASSPAALPVSSSATQLFRTGDDPNVCGLCGYAVVIDAGNVTEYTINDLPTGTYYYSLTTYDINGIESIFSEELAGAVSAATGNVTVRWSANTEPDVAGYKIYYGKSN